MADMAIWMKAGPASMLRALERFERRKISLKTRTVLEKSTTSRCGCARLPE